MIYSYCWKWRLKANVSKGAVITFGKGSVKVVGCGGGGGGGAGEQDMLRVSKYTYLGIDLDHHQVLIR